MTLTLLMKCAKRSFNRPSSGVYTVSAKVGSPPAPSGLLARGSCGFLLALLGVGPSASFSPQEFNVQFLGQFGEGLVSFPFSSSVCSNRLALVEAKELRN
jgi:hypothetical protein